jgi:hypothetical protein
VDESDSTVPGVVGTRPDPMAYGRAIPAGLGVNLLVTDVGASVTWQRAVLRAEVRYADPLFAILGAQGSVWFLHHDSTYRNHPLSGIARGAEGRGAGAELRLYGCDPDAAVAAARTLGTVVLAEAADKPHGLREACLLDAEGYCWVPCRPLPATVGGVFTTI